MSPRPRNRLAVQPDSEYPVNLSKTQRSLLASHLRTPELPVQNMALLTHIDGAVDAQRWATAFTTVVSNSDVLRTVVGASGGTATVLPRPPATSEFLSLRRTEMAQWAQERASRPIDPTTAVYDSVVISHEDETTSWFCNLHHLATDARSFAVMLQATADVYDGVEPALNNYYPWVAELEQHREKSETAAEYWNDRPCIDRISRLYSHRSSRTSDVTRMAVQLAPSVASRLEHQLNHAYRALTPQLAATSLLVTAAALYAHYLSGADALSVGLPVHNRRTTDGHLVIGPMMELFPVDISIRPDDTMQELYNRTARAVTTTLRNAKPGTSPDPDFDIVVNVISDSLEYTVAERPATVSWIPTGSMDADHLLRVQLTSYGIEDLADSGFGPNTALHLDVAASGVAKETEKRAADHFGAVLRLLVDDPQLAIADANMCSADEVDTVLQWGTGEERLHAAELLGPRLAATLANNTNTVLVDGDIRLTGDELWVWVSSMATQIQGHSRISIELNPSAQALVAVYASVIAGVSFVPIDPTHPPERRERLRSEAGVSLVIGSDADVDVYRGPLPVSAAPTEVAGSDSEAYVIFTSGSTGEPKGVPITQQGLANYISFAEHSYFDEPGRPVAALFGSFSFDLTITSLFAPILRGGSVVAIRAAGAAAISAIAREPAINWCKATPSHLELLVQLIEPGHGLRTFVVGGEAFSARLAGELTAACPGASIYNEYGPTEAVVGCMIHRYDNNQPAGQIDVPIGHPAPAVSLRIVDTYDNPTPIGGCGELLISHPDITAGYINTPEAVVEDQFVTIEGKRYYRSGDLVQLNHDGLAVYRGRVDEQLKVGGVRLDPVEVEEALNQHPDIDRAVVRAWSPRATAATAHCARCGLPNTVPGVRFDAENICDTCHTFDHVESATRSWFRTPQDLRAIRDKARERSQGPYDCLALLSGGKDSTYALYQLVEHGFRPYAFTLDNGFISDGAKANIRNAAAGLNIEHEFATTPSMNSILRDSLATFSNVCNGCYKTIYTLAVNRAAELDIPLIVTGLSRGQLFETRLIPEQFRLDRFDPEAIDRAVLHARKNYHRSPDLANRLLDTDIFTTDDVFEQIEFIDIFRYLDVELEEMMQYLDDSTPWARPQDTGRSTNCLVNVAGIHTHVIEQGYHNYAVPYAWDVRLGHKTRDEAIAELEDNIRPDEVSSLLAEIGYTPSARSILTAWVQMSDPDMQPEPAKLRNMLAKTLPAHAIPAAYVGVEEVPMTANGKLDVHALPDPQRVHRHGATGLVSAANDLERTILEVWERELRIEPIGTEDDFFSLGGDSLGALSMIVQLGHELSRRLDESLAFVHTTPRALAEAIAQDEPPISVGGGDEIVSPVDFAKALDEADVSPSTGERSVLFEQRSRPSDVLFNLGRVFRIDGRVDPDMFADAVRLAAQFHDTLSRSYGPDRRRIGVDAAIEIQCHDYFVDRGEADESFRSAHRAEFDLIDGPLLRCVVHPLDDGSTAVLVAAHHVTCDLDSLSVLWSQIDAIYSGTTVPLAPISYRAFSLWQQQQVPQASKKAFWEQRMAEFAPTSLKDLHAPTRDPDGFLRRTTTLSPNEVRHRHGASPAAIATAAASAALGPFFENGIVPLNLVSSVRTDATAEKLFGYLLNPLPLQLDGSAPTSVATLVEAASAQLGSALSARDYPVANRVADARNAGIELPSTNVLVSVDLHATTTFDSKTVRHQALFNGSAVADLSFFVEIREDAVDVGLEYRGSTFAKSTGELIVDRFARALTAAVTKPSVAIASLAEAAETSVATGGAAPRGALVIDQILHNARTWPKRVAVECGDSSLGWSELVHRAEGIARALASHDVVAGDRVIVSLPRSVNVIAAIVGVHLAGATYVPIDPTYPANRIALIRDAADARAAIVESGHPGPSFQNEIVVGDDGVDGQPWTPARFDLVPPDTRSGAYLIFTSGSTGTPSAVEVSHQELATSTNARASVYASSPRRFCMLSSVAFDSSIVGLFWTLAEAGTVVLPTDSQARDLDGLADLLSRSKLSHTLCVPTMYRGLLARRRTGGSWPRHIIVAGEPCPASLVDEHTSRFPTSALTNEYGPTETTVWATSHPCSAGEDPVPIGKPIPGTWVAVVDEDDSPVPVGVAGELLIGGEGVTKGYANNTALTAQRFAERDLRPEHRLLPQGRFFRTGDRAVMRADVVYFAGRLDDQLNVGGARVEPAEIETILYQHDAVVAVAVVAQDVRPLSELLDAAPQTVGLDARDELAKPTSDRESIAAGLRNYGEPDIRLVAHVETVSGSSDLASLRQHAAASLPATVRPTIYAAHERLPRSPSGKVDRQAATVLEIDEVGTAPTSTTPAAPGGSPAVNDRADQIVTVFRKHLRNSEVSVEDSFFDEGGNSLRAIDVLDDLERVLGVEVPTSLIFEHPSARDLARAIPGGVERHRPQLRSLVVPVNRDGSAVPIFAVHHLGPNASLFRPLSALLGNEQPMYGLAAPLPLEPFGKADYNIDIEYDVATIAATYVAEIERLAPDGPVVIAGTCQGALFAYEVAQQMQARGRDVPLLAMFTDWHAPLVEYSDNQAILARKKLTLLRENGWPALKRVLSVRGPRLRLQRRAEIVALKAMLTSPFGLPQRLRVRQYIEQSLNHFNSYAYEPYAGTALVVRGSDDRRISEADQTAGWGQLISDLEITFVPGWGMTILAEPNVSHTAAALQMALERTSYA